MERELHGLVALGAQSCDLVPSSIQELCAIRNGLELESNEIADLLCCLVLDVFLLCHPTRKTLNLVFHTMREMGELYGLVALWAHGCDLVPSSIQELCAIRNGPELE